MKEQNKAPSKWTPTPNVMYPFPPIFKYCFWGPFWCQDTKSNNIIESTIFVKFVIGPMSLASSYWVEVYSSKWKWRRIKTCRQDLQQNIQTNSGKMLTNIKKIPPRLCVSAWLCAPSSMSSLCFFLQFGTMWFCVICCNFGVWFFVCVLLPAICCVVVCVFSCNFGVI
jgi:hypothetical protein